MQVNWRICGRFGCSCLSHASSIHTAEFGVLQKTSETRDPDHAAKADGTFPDPLSAVTQNHGSHCSRPPMIERFERDHTDQWSYIIWGGFQRNNILNYQRFGISSGGQCIKHALRFIEEKENFTA